MRAVLCVLLAVAMVSAVRRPSRSSKIILTSEVIDTKTHPDVHSLDAPVHTWLRESRSDAEGNSHQFLAHLSVPVTTELKQSINAATKTGTAVGRYFPLNTLLLFCDLEDAQAVSQLDGVEWVGVYRPRFKAAPALGEKVFSDPLSGHQSVHARLCHNVDAHSLVESHYATVLASVGAEVDAASKNKIVVTFPADVRDDVINKLAHLAAVHWIEDAPTFKTLNKWASSSVQGGEPTHSRTVWQHGLTGEGQIVGIADTGLDVSSCFFYDPDAPVPYDKVSSNHRKLVTYQRFVNGKDYVGGHGSHVSGSVAGAAMYEDQNILAETTPYNGMAPGAKIAFMDIGDDNGGLRVPNDLDSGLLQLAYDAGARLHSDSWGSSEPSYTLSAEEFDEWMYNNEDAIALVAAGNDGQYGLMTVGSPATAKNIISVAAAQASKESWEYALAESAASLTIVQGGSTTAMAGVLADFSPSILSPVTADVAYPSNDAEGCSSSLSGIKNKIALINRGTCAFADKCQHAASAGALACVIVNNEPGDAIVMGGDVSGSYNIPAFMLPSDYATQLESVAASSPSSYTATADKGIPPDLKDNDQFGRQNLAYFSSRGPTTDMRNKPDVATPGQLIFSAFSNGDDNDVQCGVDATISMQGTSMATPVLAGNTALVRQYYTDGFYPSGSANPSDGFTPSGALLKATVITSAQPMQGLVDLTGYSEFFEISDLGAYGPWFEGYGLVQLNQSLVFGDSQHSMWVVDTFSDSKQKGLDTGETVSFCLDVTASADTALAVTLAWTDPPANPSATRALINDLDLTVRLPSGTVLLGNQAMADTSSGTYPMYDETNNVEKVRVASAVDGTITVTVSGVNVPEGKQSFALVVVAESVKETTRCTVSCINNCNGDTCNNGFCECSDDAFGADCSNTPLGMSIKTATDGRVSMNAWTYYKITAESSKKPLHFAVAKTSDFGDPDFYVAEGRLPTLYDFDVYDVSDDSSSKLTHDLYVEDVKGGSDYYLGVYAYCCDTAEFTITANYEDAPKTDDLPAGVSKWSRFWHRDGLFVLGVFLGFVFMSVIVGGGMYLVRWYRNSTNEAHYNQMAETRASVDGMPTAEDLVGSDD